MWMSPAAATFLCAIAGTRAVFLLFTFLLQYFSRTIARAHRERERMAGVRFLLGPRPNPRFLPSPPRRANFSSASFVARGGTNTKSSWKAPLIVLNAIDNLNIARMYTRGATRMLAGDLTDRAIFVEQRGHRLASSGQGALVLPPVPYSSSHFRNAKITWMLEWGRLGPCFNCESTRIEEGWYEVIFGND